MDYKQLFFSSLPFFLRKIFPTGTILFLAIITLSLRPAIAEQQVNISILMAGDFRRDPVDGLKDGLQRHTVEEGVTFTYLEENSDGDRQKLPEMASRIIKGKPDIAIAAGGIEADALFEASKGTSVPVVFLSVSSAQDRGLVKNMSSSGNNLTGIDTNDTVLIGKRLWFIKKLFPKAKNITCFHIPSIVPSIQSLDIAKESANDLGFKLNILSVESEDDIRNASKTITKQNTDVILLFPLAPTDKALRPVLYPLALDLKIPIIGNGAIHLERGAVVSYAGSRYENGKQAARLVHKIVNGVLPSDIPIETPEKVELIINSNLADKLGVTFPNRVWRMANKIVDFEIQ